MDKEDKNPIKCPFCGRPTLKESKYCIFHANTEEKTEEEFKKALIEYVDKIKKEDGEYNFEKIIFVGNIDFKKDLDFAILKNASFYGVIFEGDADFHGVAFEGGVDFTKASFKGNANFRSATFEVDADFHGVAFEGGVDFTKASLPPGKILSLEVKNGGNISFVKTYLENINLILNLEKEVFLDFTDAKLRNTKIESEEIFGHILQEQRKKFSQAKDIYMLLKNNFHSIGKYEDESWFFKKEKDMERKSYFHFKTSHKWLWSCFLNLLFGYGEKPFNLIKSAILIILIFACIFMRLGISITNSYSSTLKIFFNYMYFSLINFFTLGYGDFLEDYIFLVSRGRIFVAIEAFIGAFMLALFVYAFARRTGGR